MENKFVFNQKKKGFGIFGNFSDICEKTNQNDQGKFRDTTY